MHRRHSVRGCGMKGIVFTEFFEFVEQEYSPVVLQRAIDAADVPSGGVYTATGTYPATEMTAIIGALSRHTGHSDGELLQGFGRSLFGVFAKGFPAMFEGVDNAFDFIASVEGYIHIEVRKLYPDAELPTLAVVHRTDHRCEVLYTSVRHMGSFCDGLLRGCLEHFGVRASIERVVEQTQPASVIRFIIERLDA